MIASQGIPVTRVERSKLNDVEFDNIPFGRYFTDHMLEADYEDGEWRNIEIKPYQPLLLSPSVAALHYGQSIFEGIKAYKNSKGEAFIFRPYDNFRRFNISAERMQMPAVSEELFIEGMRQLIALDRNWIPSKPDHSLYIRPFMFASDELIGVKPSDTYKFLIILSPTGPYYSAPMKIYAEEKYTRAAAGGVGYAKTAGNYAASMMPMAEAKTKGYDQVLWLDGKEHKFAEEIGTMNVFFIIDGRAVTPDLDAGTILDGVTRKSVITILKDMGVDTEERKIGMEELSRHYKAGKLTEIFGAGTAATISVIRELRYKDEVFNFDENRLPLSSELKQRLLDIRSFKAEDRHGWLFRV